MISPTAGLQSTRLGMYIEDRVNKYLKRQNHPEAGEVFVRVVASSDKTVDVKPGMKARWEPQWPLEVRVTIFQFTIPNTISKNMHQMDTCLNFMITVITLSIANTVLFINYKTSEAVTSLTTKLPVSTVICRCAGISYVSRACFYCPCRTKLEVLHKAFTLTVEPPCLTRWSTSDTASPFFFPYARSKSAVLIQS